jgi:hypothetical protein
MNEGGKQLEHALHTSNVGAEIKLEKKTTSNALIIAMVCVALIAGIAFGYFVGTTIYPPASLVNNSNISKPADMASLNQSLEKYLTTNFLEQYNASAKINNYNFIGEDLIQFNVSIIDTKNGTKMDEGTVYVTKDGVYMVSLMYNLSAPFPTAPVINDTQAQTQPVPKSDKPVLNLYVMAFCPYGQVAEQAAFPAAKLLGDKIDFQVNYVLYPSSMYNNASTSCDYDVCSMHGVGEVHEDVRQMCVAKYEKDKLLTYIEGINANCTAQNVDTCWKGVADTVGVNSTAIESCFSSEGATLAQAEKKKGYDELGVSGSPTTILNAVVTQIGRTPDAYLASVCDTFNTQPSECNQTLSGTAAAPSGSCG